MQLPFEVLDKLSGPMLGMAKAGSALDRQLASVNKHLQHMERAEKLAAIHAEKNPWKRQKLSLQLHRDTLNETHAAQRKVAESAMSLGAGMGVVSGLTMKAVDAVVALGSAAVNAATGTVSFGINAAKFKESMIQGFTLMDGSVEKAEETFKLVDAFADKTPFEGREVFKIFKSVRAAGYEMEATQDILAGIFDVTSTLDPASQAQANESLTRSLLKMSAAGKLTGESLEMMNDAAAGTAVNSSAIFEELGKMRGVSPAQAKAAMSAGGISSAEGINAFLSAVQKGVDKGGPLGKATKLFGTQSFDGQVASLHNKFENIFQDVKIGPLKEALVRVNGMLDQSSPTGQRLKQFAEESLGGLFKKGAALLTPENIERAINTVLGLFKSASATLGELAEGFGNAFRGLPDELNPLATSLDDVNGKVAGGKVNWKEMGIAAGEVANAILAVAGAVHTLVGWFEKAQPYMGGFEKLLGKGLGAAAFASEDAQKNADAKAKASILDASWGESAFDDGARAARAAGDGLVAGIEERRANARAAGYRIGADVKEGVVASLDIHSPSRVMEELGMYTARGFEVGLTANDNVYPSFAAPPATMVASAGASGGMGGIAISLGDVNVNGDDPGVAERVGRDIRKSVQAELLDLFEELDLATG